MKHTYCNGSAVFEQFTIKRKLGEGSFGTVYEIQREDFGEIYKAALKVITVPKSDAEFQGVLDEGMTQTQAEEYFYSVVEDIVQEFAIMSKFKGTANVVGYEDHRVIRHADGIGGISSSVWNCLPLYLLTLTSIPSQGGISLGLV